MRTRKSRFDGAAVRGSLYISAAACAELLTECIRSIIFSPRHDHGINIHGAIADLHLDLKVIATFPPFTTQLRAGTTMVIYTTYTFTDKPLRSAKIREQGCQRGLSNLARA